MPHGRFWVDLRLCQDLVNSMGWLSHGHPGTRERRGPFGLGSDILVNESRHSPTYFFTSDCWLATHCHLPFGIFTHASVQRSCRSNLVPSPSTPFPTQAPVAIAVVP